MSLTLLTILMMGLTQGTAQASQVTPLIPVEMKTRLNNLKIKGGGSGEEDFTSIKNIESPTEGKSAADTMLALAQWEERSIATNILTNLRTLGMMKQNIIDTRIYNLASEIQDKLTEKLLTEEEMGLPSTAPLTLSYYYRATARATTAEVTKLTAVIAIKALALWEALDQTEIVNFLNNDDSEKEARGKNRFLRNAYRMKKMANDLAGQTFPLKLDLESILPARKNRSNRSIDTDTDVGEDVNDNETSGMEESNTNHTEKKTTDSQIDDLMTRLKKWIQEISHAHTKEGDEILEEFDHSLQGIEDGEKLKLLERAIRYLLQCNGCGLNELQIATITFGMVTLALIPIYTILICKTNKKRRKEITQLSSRMGRMEEHLKQTQKRKPIVKNLEKRLKSKAKAMAPTAPEMHQLTPLSH